MQIIKDKQIIDNTWTFIADDSVLINGDISVSPARWNKEKEQILNHNGKQGMRLSPTDKVEDIADDLEHISLIELDFPAFTDGRGFSQARLLRSRYNYQGEIRAIGGYMPDQVFYLSRVGVNAFQLKNEEELPLSLSTMNDFTVNYQASST